MAVHDAPSIFYLLADERLSEAPIPAREALSEKLSLAREVQSEAP
jgi:hypothetical protein